MNQQTADRIADGRMTLHCYSYNELRSLYRDARRAGFHDAAECIGSDIDAIQRSPSFDI